MQLEVEHRIHEAGTNIAQWARSLSDLAIEAAREEEPRRRTMLFAAIGGLGHAINLESQLHVVSETVTA